MPFVTTQDRTEIFYKDWGTGQPVLLSHGWPLSSDAWDNQAVLVAEAGYRAVAHDRRGHGRSTQTWHGNHMDQYADDLAELVAALDLRDIVLVGHSTGGGEVARYLGRHGTDRVAKVVLLGAVPPLMLRTEANPEGLPLTAFDTIRDGVRSDRSQFYRDLSLPFYGANRDGAEVSEGLRQAFWRLSMQAGVKGALDCVKAFSETDFTEDLKAIEVPVLVMHGTDDQIVPYADSAPLAAKLLKHGTLKTYEGLPHGMCSTHAEIINPDLLAFFRGTAAAPGGDMLRAEPILVRA